MSEQIQPKQPQRGSRPEPEPGPHHVADEPVGEIKPEDPGLQSPVTETGLPVEEQVRKEWDPNKQGGLPTPLRTGAA